MIGDPRRSGMEAALLLVPGVFERGNRNFNMKKTKCRFVMTKTGELLRGNLISCIDGLCILTMEEPAVLRRRYLFISGVLCMGQRTRHELCLHTFYVTIKLIYTRALLFGYL